MNQNELFYSLLRLSLGIAHDFPTDVSADTWQRLYEMSVMQSLVGVCYQGVSQLPPAQQPPLQLAMQWACEAEAIRGMNVQQNEEAARLTQLFAAEGCKTAILKGQANARLYPDKLSRTPGDIDIWVEGGQESVIALLKKMGMLNETGRKLRDHKPLICYHHVHFPPNDKGIEIEVHFLPSSGIPNKYVKHRLQQWLQQEIQSITQIEEGFYVPTIRFALVMQLAHIHTHFFEKGVGLRQLVDYYWLLRNASDEDLEVVRVQMKRFGLVHTAQALMWILQEVLHIEKRQMIFSPSAYRGKWMLRDIVNSGNFGLYKHKHQTGVWKRFLRDRWHNIKLMNYDVYGALRKEYKYWKDTINSISDGI